MHKLGINFDEVSSDLEVALDFMTEHNLTCGELRTTKDKNFVFWDSLEIKDFKDRITERNVDLVAAATPLFKWYVNENDHEVIHDNFGFNPRIDDVEKRHVIEHTVAVASELGISRLRIFSGLGVATDAGLAFAEDPLFAYALECADKVHIDLYLENEPVCRVHNKEQIVQLFRTNNHPRLKFWLDIANLTELNEEIDDAFIKEMAPRLGYLHIKDYVLENGQKKYVPATEGEVDYQTILSKIFSHCKNDLVVTVETHAQDNKVEMSSRAITGTRLLLSKQGVNL